MIVIILFQLVFAFITYKILKFQRKRVWNEDMNSYKLIPIKHCRMFWFLFFAAAMLPGLGVLVIVTFAAYMSIVECDYIEWPKWLKWPKLPKWPSFVTKIYNYLFKDLI